MEVRPFDPAEHTKYVHHWLELRFLDTALTRDLPSRGGIVFDDKDPIAVGFLRNVEGGFLMLDSLITNPKAKPKLRDEAVDLIVGNLIEITKRLGVSKIIAWSRDENTLIRSKKFGFRAHPHTVITLDL